MSSEKTATGLRSRLFDALDGLIKNEIDTQQVEGICYLSEQIIKTANVELETMREIHKNQELERQHKITMKREEKKAVTLLAETIEGLDDEDVRA